MGLPDWSRTVTLTTTRLLVTSNFTSGVGAANEQDSHSERRMSTREVCVHVFDRWLPLRTGTSVLE